MAKRLLLTGAGGFIAGSILAQMPPGWDVVAQSRGGALSERDGLQWRKVDPLQASALDALLMEVQPHAILHTAAIAAIDYCQQHPAEAVAANVDLTQRIAGYALETGARLVFLSTDNVFDGERGAYREDEPPNPINFYGETKARAEQIVQSVPGAVVARVSVVTGLRVLGAGNSFLNWMVQRLEAGLDVGVPANEIRTTIDVITAGRALWELAENGFSGTIHLAGNDRVNRYDMVRRIAARMGYEASLVVPNDPTLLPGRAPRPLDISLDNALARGTLKTPMLGLDAALDLIMEKTPPR